MFNFLLQSVCYIYLSIFVLLLLSSLRYYGNYVILVTLKTNINDMQIQVRII